MQTQHGENGGDLIGSVPTVSSLVGLLMPRTIAMSSLDAVAGGSRNSKRLGSRLSLLVVARPSAPQASVVVARVVWVESPERCSVARGSGSIGLPILF